MEIRDIHGLWPRILSRVGNLDIRLGVLAYTVKTIILKLFSHT
jgi:hypothetical protein